MGPVKCSVGPVKCNVGPVKCCVGPVKCRIFFCALSWSLSFTSQDTFKVEPFKVEHFKSSLSTATLPPSNGVLRREVRRKAACHSLALLALLGCQVHPGTCMNRLPRRPRSAPRRGMRIKIELDLYCYVY